VTLLDRKLLRDIWAMRGQVITIALVVAAGMAVFVASISTYDSLRAGRDRFYASARFRRFSLRSSARRSRWWRSSVKFPGLPRSSRESSAM